MCEKLQTTKDHDLEAKVNDMQPFQLAHNVRVQLVMIVLGMPRSIAPGLIWNQFWIVE